MDAKGRPWRISFNFVGLMDQRDVYTDATYQMLDDYLKNIVSDIEYYEDDSGEDVLLIETDTGWDVLTYQSAIAYIKLVESDIKQILRGE